MFSISADPPPLPQAREHAAHAVDVVRPRHPAGPEERVHLGAERLARGLGEVEIVEREHDGRRVVLFEHGREEPRER